MISIAFSECSLNDVLFFTDTSIYKTDTSVVVIKLVVAAMCQTESFRKVVLIPKINYLMPVIIIPHTNQLLTMGSHVD